MANLEQKLLASKCRDILQNEDALRYILDLIDREVTVDIDHDTAFGVAKASIRQKALKEGARMVITKINKYANYGE